MLLLFVFIISCTVQNINCTPGNSIQKPIRSTVHQKNAEIMKFRTFYECIHGNVENIRNALRGDGPFVNSRTPLICAMVSDYSEMVIHLLQAHKWDVNARLLFNQTPLMYAVSNGYTNVVRDLLTLPDIDLNVRGNFGQTVLIKSIFIGDFNVTQMLIDAGADVNQSGWLGITPLIAAAQTGDIQLVGALLNAGSNYEAIDIFGRNVTQQPGIRQDILDLINEYK